MRSKGKKPSEKSKKCGMRPSKLKKSNKGNSKESQKTDHLPHLHHLLNKTLQNWNRLEQCLKARTAKSFLLMKISSKRSFLDSLLSSNSISAKG